MARFVNEDTASGNDCLISFAGIESKLNVDTCISSKLLLELATDVFNDCVQNPKVGFGRHRSCMYL